MKGRYIPRVEPMLVDALSHKIDTRWDWKYEGENPHGSESFGTGGGP